jgi:hypothetical protein
MRSSAKTKIVLSLVVIVLIGIAVGARLIYTSTYSKDYERFDSIHIGMSEEEVLQRLGQPDKIYQKGTTPKDYCVKGWACKARDITSKMFVYYGGEPVAYIYLDDQNRIEEIFVGGS